MKKLFPVILALFGLGAGLGVGTMLKPAPEPVEDVLDHAEEDPHAQQDSQHVEDGTPVSEFVKLNNQFIVPVVENESVTAMVVLSLSLEVDINAREIVYLMEPKLTDAFLQVMFDHANHGGFDGVYTQSTKLNLLRSALVESANATLGDVVRSVLITNLLRQDS